VTQGRCAKARVTDGNYGRAGKLPETSRVKEATPAPEVLLASGEVAAIEAHEHLSMAGEAKARGAALALGEVPAAVE